MKQVFTIIFFVFAFQSQAQTFTRVSDINPSGDADFEGQILFQGKIFFAGNDGTNSGGIYFTDGTTSGTQLIAGTQNVVVQSSQNLVFVECNGKLFFVADDGTHGEELWVTDGTPTGTKMVKDIFSGIGNAQITSLRTSSASFQNKLFFVANDGVNGLEVWSSDGTVTGTTMLKDINPNSASGIAYEPNFIPHNGLLYFAGDDGLNGQELWVTDGTTNGTNMVANLSTQTNSYCIITTWNGKLWLVENSTGQFASDIFVSDGTALGTYKLSDSIPSFSNKNQSLNYYSGKLVFNNKLVLTVADSTYFLTDGTLAGTQQLPVIGSYLLNSAITTNSYIYYQGIGGLFRTDGTVNGTVNVFPDFASNLVEVNGHVCFLSTLGTFGNEPWVTDGTVVGTVRLKDVCPGNCDLVSTSGHWRFIHYNGNLYFEGDNSSGNSDLWVTDGTPTGTLKLTPPAQTNSNTYIGVEKGYGGIVYNNCLYFNANYDNAGNELWKYCDGSVGIVEANKDELKIYPNPTSNIITIKGITPNTLIVITNLLGETVLKNTATSDNEIIDISKLPSGMYFLNNRKFIKD